MEAGSVQPDGQPAGVDAVVDPEHRCRGGRAQGGSEDLGNRGGAGGLSCAMGFPHPPLPSPL